VHALLVALLLIVPPKKELGEPGTSSEVPVVFESGAGGPPLPQPETAQSAPGDPEPVPALPMVPDLPPTPAPPSPPVPLPPGPVAEAPPAPVPAPPVPLEPPPPITAPPPLEQTPPAPAPPVAEEPPPPSDIAELPPPPPLAPPAPPAEPARPRQPSPPFPGTLDLTGQGRIAMAPPRTGSPRPPRPPGSLDLSMGNVPQQRRRSAQADSNGNIGTVEGAQPTGSWRGAFLDWVRARSFYPQQAAMNGEDGNSRVRLTIDRSGRVRSVELVGRSGSRTLDLALQSIFRDQRVPPFTPDMEGETMTMTFTMRYILIYR
jgi:protein TonB